MTCKKRFAVVSIDSTAEKNRALKPTVNNVIVFPHGFSLLRYEKPKASRKALIFCAA
ncbi:hypothetical protein KEJ15_08685 [Candidatus Bathyarchaeota archaeon]|nr:hypothetical protein [Candidatus Bathyarchaeota archaeon]